jgi:hypothetical protein
MLHNRGRKQIYPSTTKSLTFRPVSPNLPLPNYPLDSWIGFYDGEQFRVLQNSIPADIRFTSRGTTLKTLRRDQVRSVINDLVDNLPIGDLLSDDDYLRTLSHDELIDLIINRMVYLGRIVYLEDV